MHRLISTDKWNIFNSTSLNIYIYIYIYIFKEFKYLSLVCAFIHALVWPINKNQQPINKNQQRYFVRCECFELGQRYFGQKWALFFLIHRTKRSNIDYQIVWLKTLSLHRYFGLSKDFLLIDWMKQRYFGLSKDICNWKLLPPVLFIRKNWLFRFIE